MKTFFIELVFNNTGKTMAGTCYPGGIITANDQQEAEQICKDHYRPYYTGGDNGRFYVQCSWQVHIPTREIIEKHWKKASGAQMPMAVREPNVDGKVIGYRYFQSDKTKKEVLQNWDAGHCDWRSPAVYFDPEKNGYVVAIHNYMCMPNELQFFPGVTAQVFKKAKQFVKDNTFHGIHFIKMNFEK